MTAVKNSRWDNYESRTASLENSFGLMADRWTTDFTPLGLPIHGTANLATDQRIDFLLKRFPLAGKRVLELGSFEGAHSYRFHHAGAKVLGIEAHSEHFLKSLLIKNALELDNTQFLLGDFESWMDQTSATFDIVSACGVLYHMTNPARIIELASRIAPAIFIWTVLYDENQVPASVKKRIGGTTQIENGDLTYTGWRHFYDEEAAQRLNERGAFSGGLDKYSIWLERAELTRILQHYGYKISAERVNPSPNPRHGANILLVAKKA
jgi:hypothetical protein